MAIKRRLERALVEGLLLPDWRVAESLASIRADPSAGGAGRDDRSRDAAAVDVATLERLWAFEPILHARLIDLANRRRFARAAEPVSALRAAVEELGVGLALRYAVVRQQRLGVAFETAALRERAEALFGRAKSLAERVRERLTAVGLRDPVASTAALLHQAGEFAVLAVVERARREGIAVDSGAVDALLSSRWTARLAAAMKSRWRLPLCLKQRIGACYGNGLDSGGPVLKLMRLATLEVDGQAGSAEALRLARQVEAHRGRD